MYTDSNDCLKFNVSPSSTNYTLSQFQQERSQLDEEPFSFDRKLSNTQSIEIDFRSYDIEIDIEEAKHQKIQKTEDSIFKYFQQKGVIVGNPQEMWMCRNRDLQKRTYQIIQTRNDCNVPKTNSSLLHRRLQKSFNLSV